MDKLFSCARTFENLLDVQYKIIIGRKGKAETLSILFSKWDFHHLMGLGKLKDLRIARKNRQQVFDDIISGRTTYQSLTASRYLPLIENRFAPLARLEALLDDNRLIFRYNAKQNVYSLIEADYLLTSPFEGNDVYIFVAQGEEQGSYYCRSFFPKKEKDYTRGQPAYTLLYKEKIKRSTGESVIQYDRMNRNQQAL